MTDNELLVWLKLRMRGDDKWGGVPDDFDTLYQQFRTDWPKESSTRPAVRVLLKYAVEISRGLNGA